MTRREQLQGVLGVAHGFGGPEVGVVDDAAVFVSGDGLAFHDPFESGPTCVRCKELHLERMDQKALAQQQAR